MRTSGWIKLTAISLIGLLVTVVVLNLLETKAAVTMANHNANLNGAGIQMGQWETPTNASISTGMQMQGNLDSNRNGNELNSMMEQMNQMQQQLHDQMMQMQRMSSTQQMNQMQPTQQMNQMQPMQSPMMDDMDDNMSMSGGMGMM